MELVVATLAYSVPDREAEALAHVLMVADSVRHAPGLVTVRPYRGRGQDPFFFLLTTWDEDDSWQRAEERYNPRHLLHTTGDSLFQAIPEQWLMRYLWGYARPAAIANIVEIQLVAMRKEQAHYAQKGWIKGLQQHVLEPALAFSVLAQSAEEQREAANTIGISTTTEYQNNKQTVIFLHLLSWSDEVERTIFYKDRHYQAIDHFIRNNGSIRSFTVESL